MIQAIFWLAVGALIGWHFPEPQWAKVAKTKVIGLFKKKDA
jgi:hypothetical protein